MGDGRLIAAQRQLQQPVCPVVVRQVVLHRIFLRVFDAEAVERLRQLVRHRTTGTVHTGICSQLLQLLLSALFHQFIVHIRLLHQPEHILRTVVHDAAQLTSQLQHPLMAVSDTRFATLQFPPFRQQLGIRYAMITIHAFLILLQFELCTDDWHNCRCL